MGPQPLGHGYDWVVQDIEKALAKGFNGATTSRSWILAIRDEMDANQSGWFQWGHNLSVMDTPHGTAQDNRDGTVSMGPQPLGHGYKTHMKYYPSARNFVSMGPQPLGHGYLRDKTLESRFMRRVSMGPQPLGHGYSNQMHDFVSRSLSFDESASILHLPSSVALRFPSPFCTFDSRFCERSPFERHFGNVLSHT